MLTKDRLRGLIKITQPEAVDMLRAFGADARGHLPRDAQETLFYDGLRLVMIRRAVQAGYYTDDLDPLQAHSED